jgi:hypothetical protein
MGAPRAVNGVGLPTRRQHGLTPLAPSACHQFGKRERRGPAPEKELDSLCIAALFAAEHGHLPELQRVIASYGEHVVMKETLAEALSALFPVPSAASAAPSAAPETSLAGPAADRARETLDHYNQAIERLKSGDWAGFGTQLDAMRRLLEDMIKQSGGH